jgi:predicted ArsR family transcriptional regulator
MNDDPFLRLFDWLTPLLKREQARSFAPGSPEQAVLDELRQGWGKRDTEELLRHLLEKHGPVAPATVEMFLAKCAKEDWAKVGSIEAHPGTEIQDFIRVLWEPLRSQGFLFRQKETDGKVEFCVTRCPVQELAERTKMHAWLFHIACATDFYSATAFSSKIRFARSKTLMEGNECCNHTYSYNS